MLFQNPWFVFTVSTICCKIITSLNFEDCDNWELGRNFKFPQKCPNFQLNRKTLFCNFFAWLCYSVSERLSVLYFQQLKTESTSLWAHTLFCGDKHTKVEMTSLHMSCSEYLQMIFKCWQTFSIIYRLQKSILWRVRLDSLPTRIEGDGCSEGVKIRCDAK